MLTFVVFEADGVDARHFPPRHAHLVGPDEIPHQGAVAFEGGSLRCTVPKPESAALVLQCEVAWAELDGQAMPTLVPLDGSGGALGLGVLTIQTCLLQQRESPYLLAMEIARHRIMLFLNKLEDWGLFDLPADHPVMVQFEAARQAFTGANVAQREGTGETSEGGRFAAQAHKQSLKAISLAINAGEGLALAKADRQIKARLSGKGYLDAVGHLARLTPEAPPSGSPILIPGAGHVVLPGPPQIGVSVSPAGFSEALQRAVATTSDFVSMPMRWVDMEPGEGKYQFGATDRWIEWAIRTAKLPVVAGPLVDFRAASVPDWLYIWENDYETLRDLVFEHVQALVTRYRRTVQRWVIASGLHVNTNIKISFDQIMDLTRMCVLLVRKLHPAGKVVLEIDQPWGEYHAFNRRSIPPYLYAEAVMQAQLNVDGIGLRVQMGDARPGAATRDLMAFSALLDRYAALEKPIHITALGAPSGPVPMAPFRPRAGADAEDCYEPGHWRQPWSEIHQADWLTYVMTIACSKPFVQSVCWQELSDSFSPTAEMLLGGLMSGGGVAKPALTRMAQIRQAMREGKSPATLVGSK
ncbi:MAG: endo-1,4-beta-xylanase [Phycisphaerales bacterium]